MSGNPNLTAGLCVITFASYPLFWSQRIFWEHWLPGRHPFQKCLTKVHNAQPQPFEIRKSAQYF
jgi:hypothetical protein